MNTNYSELSQAALIAEEKKYKSRQNINAALFGMIVGVAIWAATHHAGFLITVGLLIIPFRIGRKNTQQLKDIRAELSRRSAI